MKLDDNIIVGLVFLLFFIFIYGIIIVETNKFDKQNQKIEKTLQIDIFYQFFKWIISIIVIGMYIWFLPFMLKLDTCFKYFFIPVFIFPLFFAFNLIQSINHFLFERKRNVSFDKETYELKCTHGKINQKFAIDLKTDNYKLIFIMPQIPKNSKLNDWYFKGLFNFWKSKTKSDILSHYHFNDSWHYYKIIILCNESIFELSSIKFFNENELLNFIYESDKALLLKRKICFIGNETKTTFLNKLKEAEKFDFNLNL